MADSTSNPFTLTSLGVGMDYLKDIAGMFDMGAKSHYEAKSDMMKANLMQSSLEENMRRAEGMQSQVLQSATSKMASSGLDYSSKSFTDYLSGMATEFQKQDVFTRNQAQSQIDMVRGAAIVQDPNAVVKDLAQLGPQAAGRAFKAAGWNVSGLG
jgi:hypothetical protein